MSTGPFFVSILEPIFFNRKILISEILVGLGIIFGMLVLLESVRGEELAILIGLTSALLSALFSVMNGKIVKKIDPVDISIWEMVIGSIILGCYFILNDNFIETLLSPSLWDWFYLTILASICTSFAFVQSVRIMKYLSPFTVVLTIALEPVYGILIALIFFGGTETMSSMFYFGVAVILGMVSIEAYWKRKKRKKNMYNT